MAWIPNYANYWRPHSRPTPSGRPGSGPPARLSPTLSLLTQVSGYLNLLANTIDNFTHGLAVAASFLVSKKVSEAGAGVGAQAIVTGMQGPH